MAGSARLLPEQGQPEGPQGQWCAQLVAPPLLHEVLGSKDQHHISRREKEGLLPAMKAEGEVRERKSQTGVSFAAGL